MGAKKKGGAIVPAVANKNHSNLMDMVQSDSDSYGSEGQLKEKPVEVKIKKRGGKKRNKNGELVSCSQFTGTQQFDSENEADLSPRGNELKMNIDIEEEEKVSEQIEKNPEDFISEPKIEEKPKPVAAPYKPVKKIDYSPSMIKEYDPNDDSAKVRAQKRAALIK